MATEEIISELEGFKDLAASIAKRMAILLKELRSRRIPHPLFFHPIMRFFEEISGDALHPEAAVLLGQRKLIRSVLPLSKSQQLDIAKGCDLPVVMIDPSNTIVHSKSSIFQMSPATLRIVFGPDGLRSLAEQEDIIRKSRCAKFGSITVLSDLSMLKIGNQKIAPEDLKLPLRTLGYDLRLIRDSGE